MAREAVSAPTPSFVPRRREGFAGARHIVLPLSVIRLARADALLAALAPAAAGYFPRALGHEVRRPNGLRETVLILCLSGRGFARTTGPRVPMTPGDLAWLPPGVSHAYGADDEDPWTISWAHVVGAQVPAYQTLLGATAGEPVLRLPNRALDNVSFEPTCDALENGYGPADLLVASSRLQATLAELNRARLTTGAPGAQLRLEKTLAWMRGHLQEPASLTDLAEMASFSVPRYSALFHRRTGYPPVEYFLRLKVLRACELLDTTRESIKQVAQEVGYDDPYYFSRLFKKIMGRSPRDYRGLGIGHGTRA